MSPFFPRHALILLLAGGQLALAVYLWWRSGQSFDSTALTRGILERTMGLVYFCASLLAVLGAWDFFNTMELTTEARQGWKTARLWNQVKPGMTRQQVTLILGPGTHTMGKEEVYTVHPLFESSADVEYQAEPLTDSSVVASTSRLAEDAWLPPGGFRKQCEEVLRHVAFPFGAGLIVISGLLSLLPLSLSPGWNSWQLYLPAGVVFAALVYESGYGAGSGWRYDLWLLYPLYAVIGLSWLVRVVLVIRAR